ncbi:hypothetical protein [Methylotuvimicrobium sp. KM1]|uniref:TA system antitoxin ParD family protein n=1 Tax=Methylotuvimicrobium sp. KM1 TaxID=3377707 RepID=UPI0038500358
MAKAASPIRLQKELMSAAELTGKRFHRSTAEQIEYWVEMGRNISAFLDPDDLAAISAGLAKLELVPVYGKKVDPATVFQTLEDERAAGSLAQRVTNSPLRYQSSIEYPGCLEQIDRKGQIRVGKFIDGEFVEITKTLS